MIQDHRPRVQARVFEHVVDQDQQLPPREAHLFQSVVHLADIFPHLDLFHNNFCVTDHHSQGGAQFVAHIRQKSALGAAGGFGCLAGLAQFRFGFYPLGDIAHDYQSSRQLRAAVAQRRQVQLKMVHAIRSVQ